MSPARRFFLSAVPCLRMAKGMRQQAGEILCAHHCRGQLCALVLAGGLLVQVRGRVRDSGRGTHTRTPGTRSARAFVGTQERPEGTVLGTRAGIPTV